MHEEDSLLIRPKPAWHERIHWQTWISVISLIISVLSGLFTWQLVRIGDRQARAAERQAQSADEALKQAKESALDQRADVERSRKAAEESAKAAQKLAAGMDRSARAAEVSADAGREALTLNRRALILSNLPEIEVANSRLLKPLAPNEKPVVTMQIYNRGKGTAVNLVSRGWFFLSPNRVFTYPPLKAPPSVTDLAPGPNSLDTLTLELPITLTSDLIAAINNGGMSLYVYGISEYYDDTLEKPRKHILHWCNFYSPDAVDKLGLGICPEHNYTKVF